MLIELVMPAKQAFPEIVVLSGDDPEEYDQLCTSDEDRKPDPTLSRDRLGTSGAAAGQPATASQSQVASSSAEEPDRPMASTSTSSTALASERSLTELESEADRLWDQEIPSITSGKTWAIFVPRSGCPHLASLVARREEFFALMRQAGQERELQARSRIAAASRLVPLARQRPYKYAGSSYLLGRLDAFARLHKLPLFPLTDALIALFFVAMLPNGLSSRGNYVSTLRTHARVANPVWKDEALFQRLIEFPGAASSVKEFLGPGYAAFFAGIDPCLALLARPLYSAGVDTFDALVQFCAFDSETRIRFLASAVAKDNTKLDEEVVEALETAIEAASAVGSS
ncbi:hypothetical protein JCM10212_001384 [Sporobolomyces blumeae]